jgi:hypothetical protein
MFFKYQILLRFYPTSFNFVPNFSKPTKHNFKKQNFIYSQIF